MCVEAQRARAKNKRWRVSFYLGAAEDEHELPACLVLVSFSRPVPEPKRERYTSTILAVLEVRGVAVDDNVEAQIPSCESLDTLQIWARRAREVSWARELFELPGQIPDQ
jgi:hypothetical protein